MSAGLYLQLADVRCIYIYIYFWAIGMASALLCILQYVVLFHCCENCGAGVRFCHW